MLGDEDMARLAHAVERLWDCPIYIDDTPTISVLEMRAKTRRFKAEHGLGLIVVDYLQLMNAPGKIENRTQEISVIARGLKALAREMRVPVIALSQLSRQVESRSPRRPQLSDLRESGAIEQDADVVAFLYRPSYYGEEELKAAKYSESDEDVTEVYIAKQRNGPTGTVLVVWKSEYGLFTDKTT
jgi:replicative DNA helicase